MATLTGTKIKDSYDALLKAEDNDAIGASKKRITDGLGNQTSLELSQTEAKINGNLEVTGSIDGNISGNASTATSLETARDISVSGDVVGSASFDGSSNITINTTIQPNSVALGTDTTGDYVASALGGDGIAISDASGEGSIPTISNTGVTSNIAGEGISVDQNTGNVIITNDDKGSSQNIFKNVAVAGQDSVVAGTNNDTLTLEASTNVTITTDAATNKVIISANDTSINWSEIQGKPSPTVTLDGDLTGSGTLNELGDATITASVDTTNRINVGGVDSDGSVIASTFVDVDDNTYYVNPATSSRLNDLTVETGLTINGNATASSFVKSGGTSSQFLKADGSVDSNSYLTAESDTLQTVANRGAVTTTDLEAASFTVTGGTSSQFLKADGSLDSTAYITINDVPVVNNANVDINAGNGLSGGGSLQVNQATNTNINISHADTSSQASVNNSGNTFIQDITLDTYGHITGITSAAASIPSPNNATVTISAGSGISGGGAFTTDQSFNETITINHADTSSQSSVNNSGATVIQDVTLDTYGHVTGLASKTLTASDVGAQPAGNYFTDGDTVINMANNDGFQYDDSTNRMYVKLDGTLREIYHTANLPSFGDITAVTAGSNLIGGGTSGAVTLDLSANLEFMNNMTNIMAGKGIYFDDPSGNMVFEDSINSNYQFKGYYAIISNNEHAIAMAPQNLFTVMATDSDFYSNMNVYGNFWVGGTKNFRIDHPLKPETHDLQHACIESPTVDLHYRGTAALSNGLAVINIDEHFGMTDGTFEAINRDVQVFTTNETDWTNVRGRVNGNTLTIEAQESVDIEVSWLVIGERCDENIIDSSNTDSNGKLIVEPEV